MEIYGKHYGFAFTIRAQQRIAEMCPGQDLNRLNEVFGDGTATVSNMENAAKLCVILSEGYEARACFEDLDHKYAPLTMDIVMSLDIEEFKQLQLEAQSCYKQDRAPKVDVEPQKKTDAAEPESSSTQAGTSTTDAASA